MPRVTRQSQNSKRSNSSSDEGCPVTVTKELNVKRTKFTPSPRKAEIPQSGSDSDFHSDGDEVDGTSSYERMRQENIKANREFFSQLGILEAKENLRQSSGASIAIKPSQRGIKREKPLPKPPLPRRASLRIRNRNSEGTPIPVQPEPLVVQEEHRRPPAGPLEINEYLYGKTEPSHIDRMKQKIQHKANKVSSHKGSVDANLDGFINVMSKSSLTPERVAKVVPTRVFSVVLHPTCEKIIAAAGGKWGRVGVWDVEDVNDDLQGVVTFAPHSRPVNHLVFPTWHQDRLYSCSYDGSLRCTHFEKGVMEEVYSAPEEINLLFRNFEFLSPDTLLVGQFDGTVAFVDQRTSGTESENVYNLHSKSLRTVSVHPVHKDYFITSCVTGEVSLWDIRKLKSGLKKTNSSIVDMRHEKGVNSAYFSPITGNYILTTSADDKLSIYNSSNLTPAISRQKAIRHNNYTGRWLTVFRAVWHPSREDLFIVGSMEQPRQIELFDLTGKIVHTLSDSEYLSSVCSLNAFHPTRPIIAGGNSSGRLHVFM